MSENLIEPLLVMSHLLPSEKAKLTKAIGSFAIDIAALVVFIIRPLQRGISQLW